MPYLLGESQNYWLAMLGSNQRQFDFVNHLQCASNGRDGGSRTHKRLILSQDDMPILYIPILGREVFSQPCIYIVL